MRRLLCAVVATLVGLVLAACGDEESVAPTPTSATAATETPAPEALPTSTPEPLVSVCAPNPSTPAPGVIQVSQPLAGQQVSSPLHVEGGGVTIEGIFVSLYDSAGNLMARAEATVVPGTPTPVPGGGESLPFIADISFTTSSPQPACIWVHKDSGDTGAPIHIVQVPVLLLP